jgi:hypothetical protein
MKDKLIGTGAVVSFAIFTLLLLLVANAGFEFKAYYVKLALIFFTTSIVLCGEFLIKHFSKHTSSFSRKTIHLFSILLIIFSILISFDFIGFEHAYNWFITLGILFLLIVQLQLLNWEGKSKVIVKICSFFVLVSNLFLVIFFIAKWSYSGLNLWLNIAIATNLFTFLIGLIFSKQSKEGLQVE